MLLEKPRAATGINTALQVKAQNRFYLTLWIVSLLSDGIQRATQVARHQHHISRAGAAMGAASLRIMIASATLGAAVVRVTYSTFIILPFSGAVVSWFCRA